MSENIFLKQFKTAKAQCKNYIQLLHENIEVGYDCIILTIF